ncbi:hypothetical protein QQM39_05550 [Streptomyces sp. DT2A-34]|uniref:hypothetical protein n=1 Tax=Streptomyces sp. DT2A-34 TaxID=3051182 RepID=UPI00265C58B4|nr:hypothetical protein [Streptomyces sp. DT2A-34]MDO0910336.1 hypothetical protein [Streptomyces sp. DT2A-34]
MLRAPQADSGNAKEPAAEKSSAAPDVAKVVDNAKSSDEFFAPESGNRWIGVQFQLVNTGTKVYSDAPVNGAKMTDDQGQQFGEWTL